MTTTNATRFVLVNSLTIVGDYSTRGSANKARKALIAKGTATEFTTDVVEMDTEALEQARKAEQNLADLAAQDAAGAAMDRAENGELAPTDEPSVSSVTETLAENTLPAEPRALEALNTPADVVPAPMDQADLDALLVGLPRITRMEADVINGILSSDYASGGIDGNPVWSWSIAGKIVRTEQVAGVVSSLSRKGLTVSNGEGKERAVGLTEMGIQAAKALTAGLLGGFPEAEAGAAPVAAPVKPAAKPAKERAAGAAARGKVTTFAGKTLSVSTSERAKKMNPASRRTVMVGFIPAAGITYEALMAIDGMRLGELAYLVKVGIVTVK